MKQFNENNDKNPRPKKRKKLDPKVNDLGTNKQALESIELPPEIWDAIFSYLPSTPEQFQSLSRVNHLFHDLVAHYLPNQDFHPIADMDEEQEEYDDSSDLDLTASEVQQLKNDRFITRAVTYDDSKDAHESWYLRIPHSIRALLGGRTQTMTKIGLYNEVTEIREYKSLFFGLIEKSRCLDGNREPIEIRKLKSMSNLDPLLEGTTRSGLKRKRGDN
jgi:hypothetical protein